MARPSKPLTTSSRARYSLVRSSRSACASRPSGSTPPGEPPSCRSRPGSTCLPMSHGCPVGHAAAKSTSSLSIRPPGWLSGSPRATGATSTPASTGGAPSRGLFFLQIDDSRSRGTAHAASGTSRQRRRAEHGEEQAHTTVRGTVSNVSGGQVAIGGTVTQTSSTTGERPGADRGRHRCAAPAVATLRTEVLADPETPDTAAEKLRRCRHRPRGEPDRRCPGRGRRDAGDGVQAPLQTGARLARCSAQDDPHQARDDAQHQDDPQRDHAERRAPPGRGPTDPRPHSRCSALLTDGGTRRASASE